MSLITYGMGGSLSAGDDATISILYDSVEISSFAREVTTGALEYKTTCSSSNEIVGFRTENDEIIIGGSSE